MNKTTFLNEEFFQVKQDLYVSKSGKVLDTRTNKLIKLRIPKSKSSYISFSYNGERFDLHRVLASTFILDTEADRGIRIVNHKDGNKQNNTLENIEWVTHSGNLTHAYQTGLRDDNSPILVKDIRDGTVVRFNSIGEVARRFNVNTGNVHQKLDPSRKGRICYSHYLIIREGDSWPEIDVNKLDNYLNGESKKIVGSQVGYNTVYLFESIGMAAEKIGTSPTALSARFRRALLKGKVGIECGEWTLSMIDKTAASALEKALIVNRIKTNKYPKRKPMRVKVRDLKTDEVFEMDSLEQLALKLGVKKSAIQKHIWTNDGVWKKRLQVEYLAPSSAMANG